MDILHKLNILIHIFCGTIALIIGGAALVVNKSKPIHKKIGTIFLIFLSVVIVTALSGVFLFKRNNFLLVITILSGYFGFSGFRTLKTKSNKPKLFDISISLIAVSTVFYFLYYVKTIGMIWQPVIIYSTVGTLLMVVGYDFLRYFIPHSKYQRLWFYEHIFKMIGAYSALLSAFSGTVLSEYQPYSQILPSIFGTFLQIAFIVYFYRKSSFVS